jgi:hypothetical protein
MRVATETFAPAWDSPAGAEVVVDLPAVTCTCRWKPSFRW